MESKKKTNRMVNTITDLVHMRFSPEIHQRSLSITSQSYIFERIRSFINKSFTEEVHPSDLSDQEEADHSKSYDSALTRPRKNRLRFLEKLTIDHILIGNEHQLDLFDISCIHNKFVDTEYLWSMKFNVSIDFLAIDLKRLIIVIGSKREKCAQIFRYNHRKIGNKPLKIKTIYLEKEVKGICFLKDYLAVMTENFFEMFTINSEDEVNKIQHTEYPKPNTNTFKFYTAPEPSDSTLNIFFQEHKEDQPTFTLWLIQVEYVGREIKVGSPQKIYDIKKSLEKKIVIKNFQKEFFLMNLGSEMLAFKKGYVIDSVFITQTKENSILKYNGDGRLIHISDKKFEIYSFTLNMNKKPYKINVSSIDSIDIQKPEESEYFNLIEVMNGNFMIVFQIKPLKNNKTRGEIDYWFSLTQKITIDTKIKLMFQQKSFDEYSKAELKDKCITAQKMGMNNKEIYLELWNRSTQITEQDFALLIKTRDYDTIQQQTVAKLRKASMLFVKLHKNQKMSLSMLEEDVFTTNCSLKIMQNYIASHFWLKKLENFRNLIKFQSDCQGSNSKDSKLTVSIQDYYELKGTHLKNELIRLMISFCLEDKPVSNQIRFLLIDFRFVIVLSYRDILQEVIKNVKGKILKLLKQIPELLPFSPDDRSHILPEYVPSNFYQGIWFDLNKTEISENLTLESLKSDDNVHIVQQLSKDIWFRRSSFEGHGVITESADKIQKHLEFLKSEVTFYSIIEWIFENVDEQAQRKSIFKYIEETYPKMPYHLRGRIILYYQIYHFLRRRNILPEKQGKIFTFHEFLSFQDQYLFHHLFQKQKSVKGIILKEIKPIYDQLSSEGAQFFNQNLIHYFQSRLSTLSDLKYIFNRINNEKRQFHLNNQEMYEILIMKMGYKLMIGTEEDVPLDQILIYVENIPIEKGKQILARLKVIKDINKNADLLRKAKIKMSVEQIINDPHETMSKVIDFLIIKEKVRGEFNEKIFLEKAYKILASVEYLYYEIYKDSDQTCYFLFFLFLAKIAVDATSIPFIRLLLSNQYLEKQFHFDQSITESLVLYMYKLKMNENPIYIDSQKYLRSLITLLPEENQIRQFIICQFQFAKLLSDKPYVVQFPLSDNQPSPAYIELQYYLSQLKAEYLMNIDVNYLFELMKSMSELNSRVCTGLEFMEDFHQSQASSSMFFDHSKRSIKKREIYEQFILRFLQEGLVRQALPYVEAYLNQPTENTEYDIIYPLILLIQAEDDINVEDRQLFRKLAVKYFRKPVPLFQFIRDYFLNPLTNRQRTQLLKTAVKKSQSNIKSFDIENKLLSEQLIQIARRQNLENKLQIVIENCFKQMEKNREEFGKIQFNFLFMIMTNSPYLVAKYMVCNKKFITLKNIRVFLTYLSKEDILNPYAVLEYGRRLFLIVLISLTNQNSIQNVVQDFAEYPLDTDLPDSFQPSFDQEIAFFDRLWKSSEAFKQQKIKRRREQMSLSAESRKKKHQQKLINPFLIFSSKPAEYEALIQDEQPGNVEFKDRPKNYRRVPSKDIDPSTVVKKLARVKKEKNEKSGLGSDSSEQNIKINVKGADTGPNRVSSMFLNTQSKRQSRDDDFLIKISQIQEKQQPSGISNAELIAKPIKQILRKSALSRKNSPEEGGLTKQLQDLIQFEQKHYTQQSDPDAQPQTPKVNEKIRHKQRNFYQSENSSQSDDAKESQDMILKRKSHLDRVKKYIQVDGLPPVQLVGQNMYKENLFNLQKKANRIFQIASLKQIDTNPKFTSEYLQDITRYIYYESEGSCYIGIIHMIDYIAAMYPILDIERKNLQIYVRGQNMQKKYNLELDLRHVFPIQILFEVKYNPLLIFQKMLPTITLFIDQINVFKIAKMLALTFQKSQLQYQIIYHQLKKVFDSGSQDDEKQLQANFKKVQVFLDKLSFQMLIKKFAEIYENIRGEQRKAEITETLVEKVTKKGTKNEKIRLLQKVVEYQPSYKELLKNLRKL